MAIGEKRSAEALDDTSKKGKVGKKLARRLRKQTPEMLKEKEYRRQIEKCVRNKDAPTALEVYSKMKTEELPIQPYIYQMIINACSQSPDAGAFQSQALQIYNDMRSEEANGKHILADESVHTALVKLFSGQRNFDQCWKLLEAMDESKIPPRLRTLSPLLIAYSEEGDLQSCLTVQKRIQDHSIELTEPEYLAIMKACTMNADATVFYKTLEEYIDTVWQPSEKAWEVLADWFQSDGAKEGGKMWKREEGTVDEQGWSSVTGAQLQSLELPAESAQQLMDKVEKLVRTSDRHKEEWDDFKAWLDASGRFDVIIDAANVGYFNQNFEGGGFSYPQIDQVVQHYESQGKKVLVVLHLRRTEDAAVPEEHRHLITKWRNSNSMYNCRPGNNDDWYWLYAAVRLGKGVLVVSNDEMRDHHFEMIHNRDFGRWKERHQTKYSIKPSGKDTYRLELFEPTLYSKRPQCVGGDWHFPLVDSDRWLCFRLSSDKDE